MLRSVLLLALAFVPAPSGAAAQTPDFSGTWKIDLIKSDLAPVSRGRGQPDMSRFTLTLTQTATTLTIVQTGWEPDRTITYALDGRESVNGSPFGEMRSTSTWAGDTLVTDGTAMVETEMGPVTITMEERRSLSGDGKEMRVTTRTSRGYDLPGRDGALGASIRTLVFRRR